MITRKGVVVGIVVAMLFAWTSIAQARGYEEGYEKGPRVKDRGPSEEQVQRMHEKIGVTEEQAEKLKVNHQEHKAAMKALKEQVKEKRDALRHVLEKTDVDESLIQAAATALKDVQAKLVDERVDGILAVKSILTLEQYDRFEEEHSKRGQKRKGKRDRRAEESDNESEDYEGRGRRGSRGGR